MRKPFPVKRTDTITRANIAALLERWAEEEPPIEATARNVAEHFCGPKLMTSKNQFARPRHVARALRLMP